MPEEQNNLIDIPIATKPIKTTVVYEDKSLQVPIRFLESVASVGEVKSADLEGPKASKYWVKKSKTAGRSLTVGTADAQFVARDSNGIVFGTIDKKGTVMPFTFGESQIVRDSNSPFGLTVMGLKDSIGIEAMKKGSGFLRKHGLPTEAPRKISRVEEVILDPQGTRVPIAKWKKDVSEYDPRTRVYLTSNDFFEVERVLQVSLRLVDINRYLSHWEFKKRMTPVFRWLNRVFRETKQGLILGTKSPEPFDSKKDSDLRRYIVEWLPFQMGIYLGKMHGLEVTHGFPHVQNWSAVGTLYDLDSIKGEQITGELPGPKDYRQDFSITLNIFNRFPTMNFTEPTGKKRSETLFEAKVNFLAGYLGARYPELVESKDPKAKERLVEKVYELDPLNELGHVITTVAVEKVVANK